LRSNCSCATETISTVDGCRELTQAIARFFGAETKGRLDGRVHEGQRINDVMAGLINAYAFKDCGESRDFFDDQARRHDQAEQICSYVTRPIIRLTGRVEAQSMR
jgi:hypothetical protein